MHYYKIEFEIIRSHAEQALVLSKCLSILFIYFSSFFLQNRGVYMFRIDSEHVIDATITGGPARWKINLNF